MSLAKPTGSQKETPGSPQGSHTPGCTETLKGAVAVSGTAVAFAATFPEGDARRRSLLPHRSKQAPSPALAATPAIGVCPAFGRGPSRCSSVLPVPACLLWGCVGTAMCEDGSVASQLKP